MFHKWLVIYLYLDNQDKTKTLGFKTKLYLEKCCENVIQFGVSWPAATVYIESKVGGFCTILYQPSVLEFCWYGEFVFGHVVVNLLVGPSLVLFAAVVSNIVNAYWSRRRQFIISRVLWSLLIPAIWLCYHLHHGVVSVRLLNFVSGHMSTMFFMVCRWPQSQEGDWARPHLCRFAWHGPWSV